MKIVIDHMGPVEHFELDLDKNLTVIYGGNNIGKSYAMQVCYLLMKLFMPYRSRIATYVDGGFYQVPNGDYRSRIAAHIDRFCKEELPEGYEKDITDDIQAILIDHILDSGKAFFASCKSTFKMIQTGTDHPLVRLCIANTTITFDIIKETITSDFRIKKILLKKRTDVGRIKWETETYYRIHIKGDGKQEARRLVEHVDKESGEFRRLLYKNVKQVYFLPSSRSGIYTGLSSIGAAVVQLAQNRTFITKGLVLPSIAEPVSDYYNTLMSVNIGSAYRLGMYASRIEDEILMGSVSFDQDRGAYQYMTNGESFDLTQTSSMIAEISPIVAYLKYIIPDRDRVVVFIEEPEAHLHPENQVKLIEMFAGLARNIQLVISSHSNYIFNKLNNMVLDEKIDGTVYNPILMKPEGKRGKAYSLDVTDTGVNDENFTDITDILWEEREAIIERRNSENADD